MILQLARRRRNPGADVREHSAGPGRQISENPGSGAAERTDKSRSCSITAGLSRRSSVMWTAPDDAPRFEQLTGTLSNLLREQVAQHADHRVEPEDLAVYLEWMELAREG